MLETEQIFKNIFFEKMSISKISSHPPTVNLKYISQTRSVHHTTKVFEEVTIQLYSACVCVKKRKEISDE